MPLSRLRNPLFSPGQSPAAVCLCPSSFLLYFVFGIHARPSLYVPRLCLLTLNDSSDFSYRIHLSPGSRRSASSAARAAAQNKAAAAAAAAMAISPIQTSPIGTLGPDDGPPPLAQAHPNLPPPPLSHAAPYPHGSLSTPYPPMALHTSPHLQHVNGGSSYSVPQTPPMGSYEVESQQNGALKNGHPVGNAGLAQTPPESPASHSTPSTGPSAHVPLPPSSYPSQYMGYANYAPTGPPPKISTFYQRHHYPPEAYTGASAAPQPSSSQQPLIPADQRYQQPQAMLHQSSDQLQVVEKERRRNRPSISSISSGQSPSQSPVITNGRLGPPTERMLPSHHESGHWQNGYSPYPPNGSTGPTPTAATNGDGNYNITASSAGSYAHSNSYMHHPPPSHPHYDVRSPPLPPPQSTGSTASTNSVTNSVLSETSHASSHTSYMSHVNVPSDQGHGHPNGVRSPPPVLAPIQTRGESANGQPMGGLEMGMGSIGGYHHPARHPFRPSALPYAVSADVGGYAGNAKAYNM